MWGIIAPANHWPVTAVFLQSILLGPSALLPGLAARGVGPAARRGGHRIGTASFAALGLLLGGTLKAEIVLAVGQPGVVRLRRRPGALTLEGGLVPHTVA